MARWIAAAALGLLVATATPYAQNDISGDWDLTINGPQGAITAGCTLKQDGDKVTGSLSSPQGTVEFKGNITGNKLALAFSVDTPQGALDIKVDAEVEGTNMKGTMDLGGMGAADFTGVKK